jgi:hypothetical protein
MIAVHASIRRSSQTVSWSVHRSHICGIAGAAATEGSLIPVPIHRPTASPTAEHTPEETATRSNPLRITNTCFIALIEHIFLVLFLFETTRKQPRRKKSCISSDGLGAARGEAFHAASTRPQLASLAALSSQQRSLPARGMKAAHRCFLITLRRPSPSSLATLTSE